MLYSRILIEKLLAMDAYDLDILIRVVEGKLADQGMLLTPSMGEYLKAELALLQAVREERTARKAGARTW